MDLLLSFAGVAVAAIVQVEAEPAATTLDLTRHWAGYAALVVFTIGYLTVILEERLHLRKSIPVMLAAGLIWGLIGAAYIAEGDLVTAGVQVRESLGDYAELFLFILAAMTFVATMEERQVFDSLRAWLIGK